MEEKKTFFDYAEQVLCIFGISMAVMMVFCKLFGASAQEISAMFVLGDKGIPVEIMAQFFALSVLVVALRVLFFTDVIVKKMSQPMRCAGMLASIVAVIAAFIWFFGWFPVTMWQPWAMFFLCFGISFGISALATVLRTKIENRKMEENLLKLRSQWEKEEEWYRDREQWEKAEELFKDKKPWKTEEKGEQDGNQK